MSRRSALAIGLVALTTSAACGYNLVGHAKAGAGVLPETVRVIAVLPFDNRTGRPEIEQRLTEEVALQLSRRGGYRVATDPSQADAVLEGLREGRDAQADPGVMFAAARARMRTGDLDGAIDVVEQLLARPSFVTRPFLRVHPALDRLREHPRFQALLVDP